MARPTVRILSRYILRQHIPPLGYALAALTFAMLVNQVAKQFGNFVGKGLPWGVIFEVFALSIPFIVAMTLPMAVLVAVLYTFSHLAADNEVTAMKASGISVGRILAPVLGGATLIGLIALLWNDQILPRSNHTLRTLLVDIQRKKPTFQLKEQVINEVVPGQFFLRAARIDPATNALNDVTIYDLEDPDRRRIILADSGRMAYSSGGTDLYLTLRDGEMHEIKRTDPEHFNRTFYTINRIKVAGVSNTFEPTKNDEYRGDREMTICAMQDVVGRARQDLERVRTEAVSAVAGQLRRIAKLGAVTPPALRYPRGGVGLVIGTSLAVFSVYYVGLIGGEELGDRLIVPPFLAMWTPNLIFLIVAIPLLLSVRRAGSTAHGGDWDELKEGLFGWVTRIRNVKLGRRN